MGVGCTLDVYWYYYIIVSLVTYFGGLIILIPARIIWYATHKRINNSPSWRERHPSFNLFSRMRAKAAGLLSGHNRFSKGVIIFVWLVNMAAIVMYLTEASSYNRDDCGPVIGDYMQYVRLSMNAVFIAHYVIRFAAAADKCYMWADLYSIVDHFTVGPAFVGLYLNRNWLGMRCFRLLHLLHLPDVAQLLHIVKSKNSIRLVQVASIFASIWLVSAGFIHICENNGDPFSNYENFQRLTYWECVYWLLITMSTVGYGEISPKTNIGRAFIILFVMGSFAMFTTVIPELAKALGRNSRYRTPYKRTYGKKHIIVCGHITTETVRHFIKNFMHKDTDTDHIDVVFVNTNKPGLEMEAFFKRHFNDVKFVQGTVMDLKTLQSVKLRHADACLIIANRAANNPDSEDASNVMRATAVKNYNPNVRIVIQLLQYKNKLNLLHIPNWRWGPRGDEVICISELKNGILAQNCMAPGISTLLSNLFTNRSSKHAHGDDWESLYKYGAGHEIYSEDFSKAFWGMTFSEAASICLNQFGALLVAVVTKEHNGRTQLRLNPGNSFIIVESTSGFFIAQSPGDMKKVAHFNGNIKLHKISMESRPTSQNGKGDSDFLLDINAPVVSTSTSVDEENNLEYLGAVGKRLTNYSDVNPADDLHEKHAQSQHKPEVLDITGMFHWSPARTLKEVTLDRGAARDRMFKKHVILCLNVENTEAESGLINFVIPLRSSCLRAHELKDIVIITDPERIAKEWHEIANFPNVWVLPAGRHRWTDLREVNISLCSMCVIMRTGSHGNNDQTLIDNDAILTTLTIKSMFGLSLERRIRSVGVLTNPAAFRQEVGLAADIPTITELEHDSNVVYLDPDDDDDPTQPIHMTAPYACGKTFVSSVLYSLVSCTYLNSDVLTLTRAIITSGESAEFEKILSEGLGIVRKNTLIDVSSARPKCRLAQLSLSCGPLEKLEHKMVYGELFTQALQTYEILCLGLYRLMDPMSTDAYNRKRVVLCNPPSDIKLYQSDRVFVLQPRDMPYAGPEGGSPTSTLSRADSYGQDKDDVSETRSDTVELFKLDENDEVEQVTSVL